MKILLLCNEGMSTSLLVRKMQDEAEKQGMTDVEILATTIVDLDNLVDKYDVIMLGPQVKYKEKMVAEVCKAHSKKYSVITPTIYGMVDGKKALELALETLNK